MRERFLDLVMLLARYLFEQGREDEEMIVDELAAEGYDPQDTREALEWLEQVAAARGGRPIVRPGGEESAARVLTPAEQLKIDAAAYGYLMRLRQLGLLDALVLERVLERAMEVETDEIGLDEVKQITALVLFDRSPHEVRGHVLDLVEDRRERVYH
jgi:Smg protein